MTSAVGGAAVAAALLVVSAALPVAATADTQVSQAKSTDDGSSKPDWALLAIACVTLVVGRTVVYRRAKARRSRQAEQPPAQSH